MKYAYTAIFTPEENGTYSVHFPDLPGCYTFGSDIPETVSMAQDALCLWLYDLEQDNEIIPKAASPDKIKTENGEFTSIVAVDTETYRRFYENKTVKKSLSIPSWLDEKAKAASINLSQILQRAIKEELKIAEN